MTKIDYRKTYIVMLDTETANGLEDALAYDIGWQIIDSKGNIYESRSYINGAVFCGEKDLMNSAYYAEKIPHYWDDINNGKRILTSQDKIRKQLWEDIHNYKCKYISAHNARFDSKALQTTERYITKSKYRYFIPYGMIWLDTMKGARKCLAKTPTYIRFCEEHGFMTRHKTPRPRVTAEILFRFLSKDAEFIESHTALEDVEIETQIFNYCHNVKRLPLKSFHLWED